MKIEEVHLVTYSLQSAGVISEDTVTVSVFKKRIPVIEIVDTNKNSKQRLRRIPSGVQLAVACKVWYESFLDLADHARNRATGPSEVVCLDRTLIVLGG